MRSLLRFLASLALSTAFGGAFANPLIEQLVDRFEVNPAGCADVAPEHAQRQLIERDIARFTSAVPVPFPLAFKVMDCPMDGFVYKGTTIIVSTRLSRLPEPQRVFILAHELAHYQLRHRAAMTSFFATVVAGQPDHSAALAAINGRATELTQISHTAEFEADTFAARLMQTLGYDPMEAAKLFESIGEGRDNSTHPATGRRARAIRGLNFSLAP